MARSRKHVINMDILILDFSQLEGKDFIEMFW